MSINGISLQKASTGITVVGGTATVFDDDGLEVKNGIHVVDTTETDYISRIHATFKNRSPSLQADGTFTKGRRDINLTIPLTLASGAISYPVYRGSFEIHPEMTTAQIAEIRRLAVQTIADTELDNYYNIGSVK
jgi:hypothetical protein